MKMRYNDVVEKSAERKTEWAFFGIINSRGYNCD
jgi:hypothetical protein